MAFDAFYLKFTLDEMREKCLGGRVEKIFQPSRDSLIMLIKGTAGREKLLIVANPTAPRLHLTAASPENPAEPPMFCMLLRKHLSGARLADIFQPPMERLAVFTFDSTDEMGFPVQKRLVAELMGRTCNLYLLSPEGRILDCLRRIPLDENTKRAALPGLNYQEPEKAEKQNPLEFTDYVGLLTRPGADLLCDRLMDNLGGLSPLVCREAALHCAGDTDARIENQDVPALAARLQDYFREILTHPGAYFYAQADGTPKQFAFCPIAEYGSCRQAESFSALLDRFYTLRDRRDAMRQKSQAIRKTVSNLCARLRRKLAVQEKELSYLESVQEELNRADTDAELDEIRQELQADGYVRQDGGKAKMKPKKLSPMRFESTDGFPIYVGRNNRQNDELTFRLARKDDIWCHASKVHGSHVIISCGGKTPPDNTLTQAAQLAAYYAETTGGQNIPVDMTTVKQVKKIPSGKPGMVIYHTYKTVIVNPYKDIVVDELNAEKK